LKRAADSGTGRFAEPCEGLPILSGGTQGGQPARTRIFRSPAGANFGGHHPAIGAGGQTAGAPPTSACERQGRPAREIYHNWRSYLVGVSTHARTRGGGRWRARGGGCRLEVRSGGHRAGRPTHLTGDREWLGAIHDFRDGLLTQATTTQAGLGRGASRVIDRCRGTKPSAAGARWGPGTQLRRRGR